MADKRNPNLSRSQRETLLLLWPYILASFLIGLSSVLFESFVGSCVLNILVAVVIPFGSVMMLLHPTRKLRITTGMTSGFKLGTLIGGIGGGAYIIEGAIEFFFLGDREKSYLSQGLPVPELTPDGLFRALLANLLFWFVITVVAGIIGYPADRLYRISVTD